MRDIIKETDLRNTRRIHSIALNIAKCNLVRLRINLQFIFIKFKTSKIKRYGQAIIDNILPLALQLTFVNVDALNCLLDFISYIFQNMAWSFLFISLHIKRIQNCVYCFQEAIGRSTLRHNLIRWVLFYIVHFSTVGLLNVFLNQYVSVLN